jgi:hypothetical protein
LMAFWRADGHPRALFACCGRRLNLGPEEHDAGDCDRFHSSCQLVLSGTGHDVCGCFGHGMRNLWPASSQVVFGR